MAKTNLSLDGQGTLSAKFPALTLEGAASAILKAPEVQLEGELTKLGTGACSPVARMGDPVAGDGTLSGTVIASIGQPADA